MTTEAKEKHKQEKELVNKYYKPTRHISWIEIIPKYISPREAAALSTEEKEKLLKPFEIPRFPLPDLPPLARIRLFRQDQLGAESINRFHYCCQDPYQSLTLGRSGSWNSTSKTRKESGTSWEEQKGRDKE